MDNQAYFKDYDERYKKLVAKDPNVSALEQILQRGRHTAEQALRMGVVVFAEDNQRLRDEIQKLHRIVPHRVRAADGVITRWDAPDEFVDIEEET